MSDNIPITPGTGADVATDEVGGVHHQLVKLEFGADGVAVPVSASDPLPVTGAFYPATQPVSAASLPLPTGASTDATLQAVRDRLPATAHAQPLTDAQLRAAAVPVSGAFWQATQPISAAALPLPSGASTSALQTAGNTSLSSIDGKTPALVSGRVPVDGSGVTQPVSLASQPLPVGASTETTLAAAVVSLASILTELQAKTEPGDVQAVSASSLPLPSGAATDDVLKDLCSVLRGLQQLLSSPRGYDKTQARQRVTAAVESGTVTTVTTVTTVSNLASVGGVDAFAMLMRPQSRQSWGINHRSRIS